MGYSKLVDGRIIGVVLGKVIDRGFTCEDFTEHVLVDEGGDFKIHSFQNYYCCGYEEVTRLPNMPLYEIFEEVEESDFMAVLTKEYGWDHIIAEYENWKYYIEVEKWAILESD